MKEEILIQLLAISRGMGICIYKFHITYVCLSVKYRLKFIESFTVEQLIDKIVLFKSQTSDQSARPLRIVLNVIWNVRMTLSISNYYDMLTKSQIVNFNHVDF